MANDLRKYARHVQRELESTRVPYQWCYQRVTALYERAKVVAATGSDGSFTNRVKAALVSLIRDDAERWAGEQ